MKAILHTELRCGECGTMLQYHKDVFVRCVQLKCKERHVEYKAPAVDLAKESDAPMTAAESIQSWEEFYRLHGEELEAKWEEVREEYLSPLIKRMEEIIAAAEVKPKRKYTKKADQDVADE